MAINYFRSVPAYSIHKVRKPRMTKLGQGVEVRTHYENCLRSVQFCFTLVTIRFGLHVICVKLTLFWDSLKCLHVETEMIEFDCVEGGEVDDSVKKDWGGIEDLLNGRTIGSCRLNPNTRKVSTVVKLMSDRVSGPKFGHPVQISRNL